MAEAANASVAAWILSAKQSGMDLGSREMQVVEPRRSTPPTLTQPSIQEERRQEACEATTKLLQAEKELLQAEKERRQAEKERRQAEKERRQAEKVVLVSKINAKSRANGQAGDFCAGCSGAFPSEMLSMEGVGAPSCITCRTGVPLSALRQMGLDGRDCSLEDLAFARSLRRVTHPEAYLEFLEDWDDDSPRAIAVNTSAFCKLDDQQFPDESDGSSSGLSSLEDEVNEDFGNDRDVQSLMRRLRVARGWSADGWSNEVWVTQDLAERVGVQLDGWSIIRHFGNF